MEQDVKKLVEKTKEDEATYKRVAEERKQLEEKVALLQVSEGLSEENRQELKPVQFRLSQPAFYTNPDKMKDLIRQVEELIRKVEEVEKQYPAALGSSPSAPLMPQPSTSPLNNGIQRSMSDPNVLAPEFGMDSPPSVHKSHTHDLTEDPMGEHRRSDIPSCINNTPTVQPIMLPSLGQGRNRPASPGVGSMRMRWQSPHTLSSPNGIVNAPAEETHHNPSPIYQSYNTDNGNENQC